LFLGGFKRFVVTALPFVQGFYAQLQGVKCKENPNKAV
jgi:hypothetical protein